MQSKQLALHHRGLVGACPLISVTDVRLSGREADVRSRIAAVSQMIHTGHDAEEACRLELEAAEHAVRLDPHDADAHAMLGWYVG